MSDTKVFDSLSCNARKTLRYQCYSGDFSNDELFYINCCSNRCRWSWCENDGRWNCRNDTNINRKQNCSTLYEWSMKLAIRYIKHTVMQGLTVLILLEGRIGISGGPTSPTQKPVPLFSRKQSKIGRHIWDEQTTHEILDGEVHGESTSAGPRLCSIGVAVELKIKILVKAKSNRRTCIENNLGI